MEITGKTTAGYGPFVHDGATRTHMIGYSDERLACSETWGGKYAVHRRTGHSGFGRSRTTE